MKNLVLTDGVADGGGGWRKYGMDPSYFSRKLMQKCEKRVRSGDLIQRGQKPYWKKHSRLRLSHHDQLDAVTTANLIAGISIKSKHVKQPRIEKLVSALRCVRDFVMDDRRLSTFEFFVFGVVPCVAQLACLS
ncbi:hypothetical protein ANCCAN_12155 [Ancylostoma caninum]|uniref:Uncharacterized protein n=1 Tax=Ancylostoma caninum TaxID=29170 RepID=A0A368GBZ6_ANCCA|nr:hypothetical protein ANCCAN_12155 [Ancylostoma caninum]